MNTHEDMSGRLIVSGQRHQTDGNNNSELNLNPYIIVHIVTPCNLLHFQLPIYPICINALLKLKWEGKCCRDAIRVEKGFPDAILMCGHCTLSSLSRSCFTAPRTVRLCWHKSANRKVQKTHIPRF